MAENPVFERATRFLSALRPCSVLGLRVHSAGAEGLTVVLPYSPQIVGNPQTGVIHGGALTTLMDTACGMSTLCVLPEFEVCPTLDLRSDYMHAAEPPIRMTRSSRLPMSWALSCAWARASRGPRVLAA